MFKIVLYNILKRVDGVTDAEAREVADNIASSKEVATKADIKDMATKADIKISLAQFEMRLVEKMIEREERLVKQMYAIAGIIIATVGVMITAAGFIAKIF